MDSPDAQGQGIILHARHATPSKKAGMTDGEYTYISNLALRIGDTVWEFVAEGARLFKDGVQIEIEDSFAPLAGAGVGPYVVNKYVKGQRKNQVYYEFLFIDMSKIVLRSNLHFKMAYIEVGGFSNTDVTGFLGRTDRKGFFDREGNVMTNVADSNDIESYAQEWQVQAEEPKLFMEKDVFPQAPQKCVFVDKKSKDLLRGSRRRLSENDAKLRVQATKACGHLDDSNLKKQWCIDDVVSTGFIDIASDSFYYE